LRHGAGIDHALDEVGRRKLAFERVDQAPCAREVPAEVVSQDRQRGDVRGVAPILRVGGRQRALAEIAQDVRNRATSRG
jgi:hypothetical protein